MESPSETVVPTQAITPVMPSTQSSQTNPIPQPENRFLWLWICLLLILLSVVTWWIWGQLNFAIVSKEYSQGNILYIKYLKISENGFLTVNNSKAGFPGDYVGASDWAPKGFYSDIWINLHEKSNVELPPHELKPGDRVYLKIFHDTNNDELPDTETDTVIKEYTIDL